MTAMAYRCGADTAAGKMAMGSGAHLRSATRRVTSYATMAPRQVPKMAYGLSCGNKARCQAAPWLKHSLAGGLCRRWMLLSPSKARARDDSGKDRLVSYEPLPVDHVQPWPQPPSADRANGLDCT